MILWKDYFPKCIYFLKILIPKYLLKIVLFNKIPPVLDFDLLIFFFSFFFPKKHTNLLKSSFYCLLIWFKKHFEVLMSFQFLQKDRSTSYLQKDSRYNVFFFLGA